MLGNFLAVVGHQISIEGMTTLALGVDNKGGVICLRKTVVHAPKESRMRGIHRHEDRSKLTRISQIIE